jgi:hypothetical protein
VDHGREYNREIGSLQSTCQRPRGGDSSGYGTCARLDKPGDLPGIIYKIYNITRSYDEKR